MSETPAAYRPVSPHRNPQPALAADTEKGAWQRLMDALYTRDKAGLERAGWTVQQIANDRRDRRDRRDR